MAIKTRESDYLNFLKTKEVTVMPQGFDIPIDKLNPMLFDFQKDIVRWALRQGRAAIWADCGLGKTVIQLEWAKHIPGNVLILAPLAVSHQTVMEGQKFGIKVNYCRRQSDVQEGLTITNYEMLDHFEQSYFNGIVLDESSILKNFSGKVRNKIISTFRNTSYRLACTATPAPNDFMELGNHAEFIGAINRTEMLSMFFIHDGGDTGKWRLKKHISRDKFWEWLASWAVILRKPSDLGYEDDGFVLPELKIHQVKTENIKDKGEFLFPMEAITLQERLTARRNSINERTQSASEIINASKDIWIVWCNLNNESDALKKAIPDSVEVKGSDSREYKEASVLWFTGQICGCQLQLIGNSVPTATLDLENLKMTPDFLQKLPCICGGIKEKRVLISKSSIFGFGMNFQNCHKVAFVGLSDSYEQFYQAIRRCWRFGQKKEVDCYIIISETEGNVLRNIQRKEYDSKEMIDKMLVHMHKINENNIKGVQKTMTEYKTKKEVGDNWTLYLGDCIEVIKEIKDNSINYSIFSPPFASLYTYSNSERDMGNSKNYTEFFNHFNFLIAELYRVIMPGRLLSFHCMNLPTTKEHHGVIGLQDFRGDLIRTFQSKGFIFHSEVCIWKDPVTAMQRTKALGLLYKQLKKDSAMCRQGVPDYLVTMRKPGDNSERISHNEGNFPCSLWQKYASPVWIDIGPSDTLQYRSARENNDERHICPLQLTVIRRALELWTNPGDIVLSPFAGIGSEGYCSLEMNRQFIGIELKESYFNQAVGNLKEVKKQEILF